MSVEDPQDLDRVDREIRINELREEIREVAGESVEFGMEGDCPPEIEEDFLNSVLAYEKAEWTTNFQQLLDAGVELPAPEELSDQQVTAKLWEVIEKLARLRVFLECTDHLSDRELYAHLWHESLREEVKALHPSPYGAYHVDILGGCSEQDILLRLKYYADEEERRQWLDDCPADAMPPHEDPPYDRDSRLPAP